MTDPDAANEAVRTSIDRDTASATGVVAAPVAEVFDFIRRPANHAAISGDGSVQGETGGARVLGSGDRFGMKMRIGLPYQVGSKVVEFEENRLIAWAHFSGHRWRWQLEPLDDGRTRVTETFDLSTARLPIALRLVGLPKGHENNLRKSVANVIAHFARSGV